MNLKNKFKLPRSFQTGSRWAAREIDNQDNDIKKELLTRTMIWTRCLSSSSIYIGRCFEVGVHMFEKALCYVHILSTEQAYVLEDICAAHKNHNDFKSSTI